tara:strand:+ start:744 stop:1109 length:366 start_codon:yes stop_codon:yes gene_type:complete
MPSIILSEWVANQSRQRIINIGSRGIKLNHDEIYWILSQMGEVMSLAKLHRKVAVTHAVLKDMEIGEVLPASEICIKTDRVVRKSARLTIRSCGHLLKLLIKWGYVERIWDGRHWQYRRIS